MISTTMEEAEPVVSLTDVVAFKEPDDGERPIIHLVEEGLTTGRTHPHSDTQCGESMDNMQNMMVMQVLEEYEGFVLCNRKGCKDKALREGAKHKAQMKS